MPDLLVETRGAVAWLTLNRPAVRNAINLELRTTLADTLTALAADPGIRALVLAGAGPDFCAGGDVTELGQPRTDEDAGYRIAEGNRMIQALYDFPVPTIAAVRGTAAGAGCCLPLACDLAIAAESARFRLSFVGMGLGPDAGCSALLPARVGPARAKELLYRSGSLPAFDALAVGLVAHVVPDAELAERVDELAQEIGQQSRPALVATKRLVNAGLDLSGALDAELRAQVRLLSTVEHRAAREAFLRKRVTA